MQKKREVILNFPQATVLCISIPCFPLHPETSSIVSLRFYIILYLLGYAYILSNFQIKVPIYVSYYFRIILLWVLHQHGTLLHFRITFVFTVSISIGSNILQDLIVGAKITIIIFIINILIFFEVAFLSLVFYMA